jgi:rod shape-determining protein MreC
MKKINFKILILFLATLGLLVFLNIIGALKPVKAGFQLVLNPLASQFYSISSKVSNFFKEQGEKKDLEAKINELNGRTEELEVENSSLRRLEEENNSLRQHLKFFSEKKDYRYILANVISRSGLAGIEENVGEILIGKGTRDGLRSGLAVLDEKGTVVGKIYSCEEKVSKVALTVASRCRLAVSLGEQDRTNGLAEGRLGLTIDVSFVPQTAVVKAGDLLITSGLEPDIPAGLLIGEIIEVYQSSNEVWQKVAAESAVDLENVIIVSVLLPR